MSHTATQQKGPAYCLCQQEPHGCGDKVCQHRERTSSNCLCLLALQHISTWKELHSREQPQAIRNDCHEESCQCTTPSSEDVVGITGVQCHHQVQTRSRDVTCRHFKPLSSKSITEDQAGCQGRLHHLHKAMD